MTTKRLLALILTLILSLSATAIAVAEEPVTLSVWHIWPDRSEGEGRTIDRAIEAYQVEHPGVTIEQDASDTESYKTKLKVAFTGGDLPDVFFTYGSGFSKPFVETGRVQQLDTVVPQETLDRIASGADYNFIYDDKLYALPLKMWIGTLYCNTEIFEKEGLTPPTTWDELISVCETFREKGYQPMCMGGKDAWHIAMYFDQIALRMAGVDGVNAAMHGEKKFNDPEFLAAAEKMMQLVDMKAFNDGFAGLGAQEAQAEFFMGRQPMYFNGSWLTGDCQSDTNQIKDKIVALPFPSIEGGAGENCSTGGAIDGWAVSGESKKLDQAIDFMSFLCEYMSNAGYLAGDGISVWKNDIDPSELNPVLVQINGNTESIVGYSLAWDTQLSGADIDTYLQSLQKLVGGGFTPQQFVDNLQENLSVAMK